MPQPTKKTTKKQPLYEITAKMMGKRYTGRGKTLMEAIDALGIKGGQGSCVMCVKRGNKETEKVLNTVVTARLFSPMGTVTRQITSKQVVSMFE